MFELTEFEVARLNFISDHLFVDFSDSDKTSHLGVIPYSEVFQVIMNCLQYVS